MMSKIIGVSNHNNVQVDDIVIAENVHEDYARVIVGFLQAKTTKSAKYYPKLVEDGYVLHKNEV